MELGLAGWEGIAFAGLGVAFTIDFPGSICVWRSMLPEKGDR